MIVKYPYFAATGKQLVRGFVKRVHTAPHVHALFACGLILLGIAGATGFTLAGAQPANAGSTCRQNTDYAMPSALSLPNAMNGLSVQDDAVSTYGVSGASEAAIRDALNTCAPSFMGSNKSGEFLAYTSYTINWDYGLQLQSDGTCRLENVKVGLHVSQLEPELLNQSNVPTALQSKWNTFIRGLRDHEDGHKAIDIAQVRLLLANLNDLQESCATITASAQSLSTIALKSILTENENHDTVTNYGRSEGAVW